MNHLGLFEGIGGFSLAARWMGWRTLAWCEWNEFGQKVLRHHFPEAEGFGDITKTDFTKYANRIDILTGGFPCQPYSLAGKRKGKEDERHLFPEMLRAIREIQPRWVVGENVGGLINWNGGMVFDEVQADLEAAGYEVWPYVLPACAVNAPHRRDRVWFIAHNSEGGEYAQRNFEQMGGDAANSTSKGGRGELQQRQGQREFGRCDSIGSFTNTISIRGNENERRANGKSNEYDKTCAPGTWQDFPTQSPICSGDDGLSTRLDGITFPKWRNESIKAAGNAIVPQVALQIFKTIQQMQDV